MNSIISFSFDGNLGRGGAFVPLSKVIELATAIADGGWLETSVITVCAAAEAETSTVWEVLIGMLREQQAKKEDPDKATITICGKTLLITEIISKASGLTLESTYAPVTVTGHSRVLSLSLLQLVGLYNAETMAPRVATVEDDKASKLAVRDNEAHSLATRLDAIARLRTALALIAEGEVQKETDLRKIYKDGTGQKLWIQVQAVQAGMPVEEACLLRATTETRKAVQHATGVVEMLRETLKVDAEAKANRQKVMAGDKIRELAGICHDSFIGELVSAIANGQEATARDLCRNLRATKVDPTIAE